MQNYIMIIGTFGEGKVGITTSFLIPLSDTHSIMDATNSYNHLIWIRTVKPSISEDENHPIINAMNNCYHFLRIIRP